MVYCFFVGYLYLKDFMLRRELSKIYIILLLKTHFQKYID